jgi:NADH-quinone oxidoreductase subunit J
MTTKPELYSGANRAAGLAAVALFVVLAAVFLGVDFGAPAGFPTDASVTASLGYSMFDITGDFVPIAGESMLAAFLTIALALDAALEGSLLLARREEDGDVVTALMADGGEDGDAGLRSVAADVLGRDGTDETEGER